MPIAPVPAPSAQPPAGQPQTVLAAPAPPAEKAPPPPAAPAAKEPLLTALDAPEHGAPAPVGQPAPAAPQPAAPSAPQPAAHAEQSPAPAGQRTYQVRPGDTLSGIATAQGVAGGWQAIYQANRGTVGDANLIRPGQRLTLA
ncbi:MAG: LysM peptidoglycan-binding domain-containing protein [Pseudonocardia sp.]|nr:LysM peptidoglycan-binding domain-containing protein [Pseudonocardia sp.]